MKAGRPIKATSAFKSLEKARKIGRSREAQIASQDEREKARVEREAAQIDAVLLEIAKQHLNLETLELRNRDCLDFHDLGVGSLKRALQAAYEAGQKGEHVRKEMGL